MKKQNSLGFTAVEGLLILVVILLVGFVGYYVATAKQKTNQTLNNANSANQSTASVNNGKASLQNGYFTIKEWGVRAKYSSKIELQYKVKNTGSLNYAEFSSAQLASAKPTVCDISTAGGIIDRFKPNDHWYNEDGTDSGKTVQQEVVASSLTYKKVGQYYYVYKNPQVVCGSEQALQKQTTDSVKSVLSKLEDAK